MTEAEWAELRADMRYLKDRAEILDCLTRYCRGLDRLDRPLAESAFHPDAVADPRTMAGALPDQDAAPWTSHSISNTTYDIAGDTAHTETYVVTSVGSADEAEVTISGGRYIGRLERRDGEWRLVRFETAMDYRYAARTMPLPPDALRGRRDRHDRSYDRPLELSEQAQRRYEAMPGRG